LLAMRLVWVEGIPGMPEHVVAEARRVFLGNRDKIWTSALTLASTSEIERFSS
jgi:hypothetical protein